MTTSSSTLALAAATGTVLAVACIPMTIVASSGPGSAGVRTATDLAATYQPLPSLTSPDPGWFQETRGPLDLWMIRNGTQLWFNYDTSASPPTEVAWGDPAYGSAQAMVREFNTMLTHYTETTFSEYPLHGWGVFDDPPLNMDDLTLHEFWSAPFGSELVGIGWAEYAGELFPAHMSIGLFGDIDAIMLF